jgi:mitochondrial fission protein ELM1
MENSRQNEIHIVCLLDGKPGHEKQTLGIIQALKKNFPVKVSRIKVARQSAWGFVCGMICLHLPCPGLKKTGLENPDLIITTGSQTHQQALLYKKKHKIPAITCMAPDRIYRSQFDLCFVPVHDGFKQKGNIVNTVGPPNCSVNRGRHQENKGLMLLGGIDQKSHRWNSTDILKTIEEIIKQGPETEWLISSSPRTPDETILMLERQSLLHSNVSFFNYEDTQPGWVEQQYDNSSVVWVTADSVSMMFEALTAGCKVGIIPVDWKKKNDKFERSVSFLVNNNFVLPYAAWVRQKGDWSGHGDLNEAQRCADLIIKRWWQKNL